MDGSIARRTAGALLATVMAAGLAASPAAARKPCSAPDEPAWHSCLATLHDPLADGQVRLTHAMPRLVVRADRCRRGAGRRTVTIRAETGERLARATVRGRCRRGVSRWSVTLRPDADVPAGTVVRSYWTGIRDDRKAPGVKLG